MEGYLDHHQWLVNNNLLTDQMKDNIAMCGYCLVEDTLDVQTYIDFNKSTVVYELLLPPKLHDNLMLLKKFKEGGKIGFFESFRLRKFIKSKKEHDETGMGYELEEIGNKFVRSYLSDNWSVQVKLSKEVGDEEKDLWLHSEGNKSFN